MMMFTHYIYVHIYIYTVYTYAYSYTEIHHLYESIYVYLNSLENFCCEVTCTQNTAPTSNLGLTQAELSRFQNV